MPRRLLTLPILVMIVLALAACKPKGQVGDACVVTGDSFTRKDSCSTMCVNWEVTCPSGATLTPDICAGAVCGATGACPDGQFCMQVDSFPENARCMPIEVCGVPGPTSLTPAGPTSGY